MPDVYRVRRVDFDDMQRELNQQFREGYVLLTILPDKTMIFMSQQVEEQIGQQFIRPAGEPTNE